MTYSQGEKGEENYSVLAVHLLLLTTRSSLSSNQVLLQVTTIAAVLSPPDANPILAELCFDRASQHGPYTSSRS